MLINKPAVDFEFYSENGRGAFQGQGYIYRNLNKCDAPLMIEPWNKVV